MSQQGDGLVPAPVLEDGIVRLRPWATTDLACVKAASDEAVIPETTTVPHSYTEQGGREWIERQHSRVVQGQGWSLAITEMPQGPAVGCGVLLLRPQEAVAGIGYWLVPSARGRGLASRAVALLTEWGLRELRFARIEAWVEPGNEASQGVLSRCGYEYEGCLRSFLSFETRRADALVFSRIGAA